MTNPDPTETMFKPAYEGERPDVRKEQLLAGNLGYLMALEANGLERPASELVEKIGAGLARRRRRSSAISASSRLRRSQSRGGRHEH